MRSAVRIAADVGQPLTRIIGGLPNEACDFFSEDLLPTLETGAEVKTATERLHSETGEATLAGAAFTNI